MKWGRCFFCKKVKNGGVFVKQWKMGGYKKVDLSSMQGASCTVLVFIILHFTYLGVHTHPTHPLPTGLDRAKLCIVSSSRPLNLGLSNVFALTVV